MFTSIKNNLIYIGIGLSLLLIAGTVTLSLVNQRIMEETDWKVKEAERCIGVSKSLHQNLMIMDLGVRGYVIGKTEGLLSPFTGAAEGNKYTLADAWKIVRSQNLPTDKLEAYDKAINDYVDLCWDIVALAKEDKMDSIRQLIVEDRGGKVFAKYVDFSKEFDATQNAIREKAEKSYQRAVRTNTIFQIILLALGVPSLLLVFIRLRKQSAYQKSLLTNVDKNNREFVFNPGGESSTSIAEILNASMENIKNASHFIKEITAGNTDVMWPGMNERNAQLNKENLSGTLLNMRDELKRMKDDETRRSWTTEGIAKFTELIRQHQDDIQSLTETATNFITRYMKAQQGATFVLNNTDESDQHLELTACYAFDKKKFMQKRIDIGEGLIGQAFLEGGTIFLKQVPKGYTTITSGLGEATPTTVLIVPMKYNEKTEGIFELAGFTHWPQYQQQFVEKATEYMAAAIGTVRSTQKMKMLVDRMQQQTQQLHEQEEEMRQNMEELAATNEEMKRKEKDYIERLKNTNISA